MADRHDVGGFSDQEAGAAREGENPEVALNDHNTESVEQFEEDAPAPEGPAAAEGGLERLVEERLAAKAERAQKADADAEAEEDDAEDEDVVEVASADAAAGEMSVAEIIGSVEGMAEMVSRVAEPLTGAESALGGDGDDNGVLFAILGLAVIGGGIAALGGGGGGGNDAPPEPVNRAPTAADDAAAVDEGATVTGNVGANDTDPDGDALTFALTGTAPAGLTFNGDGSFTFDANNAAYDDLAVGETRELSIGYTATDPSGSSASATLTITVTGTNDDPVAVADVAAATEGGDVVTGSVAANDSDVDASDVLTYALDAPVAGLTLNADGSYSFDPTVAAYNGLALGETLDVVASYTVSDGNGGAATSTLTITVTGTNDAPVAVNDTNSATEDGPIVTGSVATNDSDPDNGADLSYALDAAVAGLTLNADGSYIFDPSDPAYQSIPVGSSRDVTASYTVTDENGATDTATLTITVAGVNDAPNAGADLALNVNEDGNVVTGNLLTDATDVDMGDVLSITQNDALAGLVINSDGSFTFDPSNAAYQSLAVGETQTVSSTYTVSDGNGGTDVATISFIVTGTNDAPVAVADVAAVDEDATITGSVAANDSDVDASDVLTYSLDTPVAGLTLNADGSYSFDASNAVYQSLGEGQQQVIVANYTVSDGNGGTATSTLTITVTGTNDAPVAVADVATAVEDGPIVSGSLATNDSDVDANDTLTYSLNDPVAGLSVAADGSFTFDPSNAAYQPLAAGETLDVVATYTVTDSDGATDTATLTITITGTNDAPVAVDDADTAVEDGPVVSGSVAANDTDIDNGDTLTYSLNNGPIAGLVFNADGSYTFDASDAAYQDLAEDETRDVVATYTVDDGNGGTDTATLTITVTGTNDAPVAADDVDTATEDGPVVTGSVAANDTDVDASNTLTYELDAPVAGLTLNADGSYSFDPSNAAYQSLAAGVTQDIVATYIVRDGNGGSDTATLTITITGTNDDPVAVDDTNTAVEDGPVVSGSVAANDTDIDNGDTLTYSLNNGPIAGLVFNANGSYTFDASDAAYQDLAEDETRDVVATYTVDDGNGGTDTATLTITVTGTNDAPVITSGATANIDENEPAGTVVYQASAQDVDASDTLSYTLEGVDAGRFTIDPATGTVRQNGPLDFEQQATYNFTVVVTDGDAEDSQAVVLTVNDQLDVASLDVDSDADLNTAEVFNATGQNFLFTDSGDVASNAEIINWDGDDFIQVDVPSNEVSFSSSNDGSSTADDLIITINNDGVVSRIVVQDVIANGDFVNDEASAEAAVGYDFFSSTEADTPAQAASVDQDNDSSLSTAFVIDASGGAFVFTDDASIPNNVIIQNFGADDVLEIINGDPSLYDFSTVGDDLVIVFNGPNGVNRIVLEDAADETAFVFDEASAEQAVGNVVNGGMTLDFFQP